MAKKKAAVSPRTKAKKKAAPKKAATKSRRTSTKTTKKSAATVDGILKTFEKERVVLNDKVVAARKKIEQLTKKLETLKSDLEGTKREIVESELAIETLDARRDKEIGVLLSGLGVDLGKVAAASKQKPPVDQSTPLFDKPVAEKSKPAKKEKVAAAE